jgi:hypothetical protein
VLGQGEHRSWASWPGREHAVVAAKPIGSINQLKAMEIGPYHRKFSLIVQRRHWAVWALSRRE